MPPKRKVQTLEDLLEQVFCYYCEKICSDLKALQDHQKVKHLQCDQCWKKMDSLGGLKVHHESVHKLPLTTIANALPDRSSPDGPEIYLMEGVPQEMKDAFTQGIIRRYEEAELEHRIRTGNPMPGSAAALNAAKKIKVEETQEEIAARKEKEKIRRHEWMAARRAEKAAKEAGKQKVEQAGELKDESEQHDANIKSAPSSESQYFEQQYYPGYSVSVSPPTGGLPLTQPPQQSYGAVPMTQAPQQTFGGYGMGPQYGFSPTGYAQPAFQPSPLNPVYYQPAGYGYGGSPQAYALQPAAGRSPPTRQSPTVKTEPGVSNSNSLPPAVSAGLPQRPNFNAPSYSKEAMEKFHAGQTVPKAKSATGTSTDVAASGKASSARSTSADQSAATREAETVPDTSDLDTTSGETKGPTTAKIVRQLDDLLAGGDQAQKENATQVTATEAPTSSTQAVTSHAKQSKGDAARGTVLMYHDNDMSPEEKKSKHSKYAQLISKKRREKGRNDTVVEQADSQAVTGSVADDLEQ